MSTVPPPAAAAAAADPGPQDRTQLLTRQILAPVTASPTVLTPESVLGYYAERAADIAGPIPPGAEVAAEDSSTGNLNYCFVLTAKAPAAGSVFVKQAPDFVRCLGEAAKLTTERIRFEVRALA